MSLKYISTRASNGLGICASEAIIKGLADDGGLFVPEAIPSFNINLNELKNMGYKRLAREILSLYLDFEAEEIEECVEGAYGSGFDDPLIAPLVKKGEREGEGTYFLELFHGKTLAFKDMALSILPHLMITAKKRLGIENDICILTATSGDTGKAALAGFAGVPGTRIIVFYPDGGVSDVQRLQMVTQEGGNAHVFGIKGNFDDAQTGVKNIFAAKREIGGALLSSANSINIGRLLPQIVYYYYAYAQLLNSGDIEEGEKVDFVVPTGNFGNILAGYYAGKMGLPVGKLVCASNSNKVLFDFFTTGEYDSNRDFVLTISPSMDILVSSNLERLLYDISGGDGDKIKGLMGNLSSNGKYVFPVCKNTVLPGYATEGETRAAIREMYGNGYVIDTHTAVAYAVYSKLKGDINNKVVILSTASPYKFAADVCGSIAGEENGKEYGGISAINELEKLSGIKMPAAIDGLDKKEILHSCIISKEDMQKTVETVLAGKN